MSLENEDDWMKCTDWLVRCGILTDYQKRTIFSVEHLAIILKDGVLLCSLLNIIKPGCVNPRDFCLKPQASSFLCQKNVKTFLKVCKSSFGIKDKNLFHPNDLLDLQDIRNVIISLSTISQTKEMKKIKIEPFVADSEAVYIIMQNIMDECEDEYSSSMYGFQAEYAYNDKEEIYDSLVIKKMAETRIQKTKTEYCLDELSDTERNFLDVLDIIINNFMKVLESHIQESEFEIIFHKIKDLKEAHSSFYEALQKTRDSENVVISTAKCFIEARFSFVIYGDFCSKIHLSRNEINRLVQSNINFKDLINKGYEKINLVDLLSIPSQRILKYHLIIKELLKSCHDKPEEVKEVKKALETMEDLGVYINEVKRDYENINNIHEIKASIKNIDNFWEPFNLIGKMVKLEKYGRLHFDGVFDIKDSRCSSYNKRYLFLFDKLLLICQPFKRNILWAMQSKETDHYLYKGNISIQDCSIEQDEKSFNKKAAPIKIKDSKESVSYLISSDRAESLTKLFNYLNIAKDNTKPQGYNKQTHDFVLSNFNSPTECHVCHKLLRGLLSQGYHCKETAQHLHKECLPKDTTKPKKKISGISNHQNVPNVSKIRHHFNAEVCSWFSAAENRNEASNLLGTCPSGTFLVRWSEVKEAYVIGIKIDKVRHMVVKKDDSGYQLKNGIAFNTLPLLVAHYKKTSLVEAFPAVDSRLLLSLKDVIPEMCTALEDFSATEARQLTFLKGDKIQIVSKEAGGGFWRGKLNGKRGIFPSNYVELVD